MDAYNAWKLKNTNQNDVEAVPKNIEQNDVELMPVEQPAVATSENAPDAVYYFDTAVFLVTTMNELVLFVETFTKGEIRLVLMHIAQLTFEYPQTSL